MATNFANASFQEVIDLHTESNTTSVVGLHTPNNSTPIKMLHGFYEQFRKFKYNGCSVSLVPAARLPADPLQVSYEAGEPTIDPRDMLNPIMFKGCHGNDMGSILNTMYSSLQYGDPEMSGMSDDYDKKFTDSADVTTVDTDRVGNKFLDALYYRALVDKTWLKAHPQRGFRKSGLHPMVYSLATNYQLAGNPLDTMMQGTPRHERRVNTTEPIDYELSSGYSVGSAGTVDRPVATHGEFKYEGIPSTPGFKTETSKMEFSNDPTALQFFTPRLQRLGWMDTSMVVGTNAAGWSSVLNGDEAHDAAIMNNHFTTNQKNNVTMLPKVFMGMIMLPPAYKTEQYYRLVINHSFSFKGFRGASQMIDSNVGVFEDGSYATAYNLNE